MLTGCGRAFPVRRRRSLQKGPMMCNAESALPVAANALAGFPWPGEGLSEGDGKRSTWALEMRARNRAGVNERKRGGTLPALRSAPSTQAAIVAPPGRAGLARKSPPGLPAGLERREDRLMRTTLPPSAQLSPESVAPSNDRLAFTLPETYPARRVCVSLCQARKRSAAYAVHLASAFPRHHAFRAQLSAPSQRDTVSA